MRICVTFVLEGSFIGVAAYFNVTDMWTLFYIAISVAGISGFYLMIHWFIVINGKARKEFEKDMVDMMNILSVIQIYWAERQYQGDWKRGEWNFIYKSIIKPELIEERKTITRFLDHHLPDLTPRKRNYLLSKFYELNPD